MEFLFDVDEVVDEVGQIVKVLQEQTIVDTRGRPTAWPADDEKDRVLVGKLLVDFPTFRLEDYQREMPKLAAWMLDMKVKRGINVRARVRTWVSNCNTPGRRAGANQRANAQAGPGGRRPSVLGAPGKFERSGVVDF